MGHVLLHALEDSLIVLAFLVPINILIALLEPRLAGRIKLKGALAPLVGVTVGLFPQCGFSVVATDLYKKRHITVGTLLGVYLATSDEALPIFLASGEQAIDILPLLASKFLIGLIVGYTADAIFSKNKKQVAEHIAECDHEPEVHFGCCGHEIESGEHEDEHDHSACDTPCGSEIEEKRRERKQKLMIHYIGEDRIMSFLSANKYVAPLFAVIVGAIPNCASSVVISNLYLMGGLGFGATVGGLLMNAGLGFAVLLKDRKNLKESLAIIGGMFAVSIAFSYILSAAFGFDVLHIV